MDGDRLGSDDQLAPVVKAQRKFTSEFLCLRGAALSLSEEPPRLPRAKETSTQSLSSLQGQTTSGP